MKFTNDMNSRNEDINKNNKNLEILRIILRIIRKTWEPYEEQAYATVRRIIRRIIRKLGKCRRIILRRK